jgi:hypothetical protein
VFWSEGFKLSVLNKCGEKQGISFGICPVFDADIE